VERPAPPSGHRTGGAHNATGEVTVRIYDAVVLATGYERQMHRKLLAPLEEYLGDFEVDRNYKLITDERCKAGIYMQGFARPAMV
jgi:L-ornithine N5-oxygenase